MAKLNEDIFVIKVSELLKDNEPASEIINEDVLEQVVAGLCEDRQVLIEIIKDA